MVSGRRSAFYDGVTVVLAALIIIGGFVSPSLFYPLIDSYQNETVVLATAEDTDVSQHVFEEAVSLYPWNLYATEQLRPLSGFERDFLLERQVPQFLFSVMAARGMNVALLPTPPQPSAVAAAFDFLITDTNSGQGCYVLDAGDFNGDGAADLRCAVDEDGNVITLVLLSGSWPVPEPEVGAEGVEPTSSAASGESDTAASEVATVPESRSVESLPGGQDLAAWEFVDLLVGSARNSGQLKVEAAVTQLDAGFAERYGYPYTSLRAPASTETNEPTNQAATDIQPADDTELSATPAQEATALDREKQSQRLPAFSPTPLVYATEEYELFIYDLPNGMRLILYMNPVVPLCLGFNLQGS
jgi:hypothetical protein